MTDNLQKKHEEGSRNTEHGYNEEIDLSSAPANADTEIARSCEDTAFKIETLSKLLPDLEDIRRVDYPQFDESDRVYLDNGATSQPPLSVINRMYNYRRTHVRGSNHSKNSQESTRAQDDFEAARAKVNDFFGAGDSYQTVFTSGTTDSSNFIGARFPFEKGDTLILTEMEHNSQILTARNFAEMAGANVVYIPINNRDGKLDLNKLEDVIRKNKQKEGKILMNLVHVSNFTGVVNPVTQVREILGDRGFLYLDMAQSAGHLPINLEELDVDFAGFSGHKVYGPNGIGGLFINERSQRQVTSRVSGGSAIDLVSKWFTVNSDSPAKFEPGTQNIEGAIELGFTLDYLNGIGMEKIEQHDKALGEYCLRALQEIDHVITYGPDDFNDRIAVIPFNIFKNFLGFLNKNHDEVARALNDRGISVRDGCFCAHLQAFGAITGLPSIGQDARAAIMKLGISDNVLKLPGAVRITPAFYNSLDDIERTVKAIKEIAR